MRQAMKGAKAALYTIALSALIPTNSASLRELRIYQEFYFDSEEYIVAYDCSTLGGMPIITGNTSSSEEFSEKERRKKLKKNLLSTAKIAAEQVQDPVNRSLSLTRIARSYACFGSDEEAIAALTDSLTTARTIANSQEYSRLLISISDVYGPELGDLGQMNRLLEEATVVINDRFVCESALYEPLSPVARVHIRARQYEKALSLLNSIEDEQARKQMEYTILDALYDLSLFPFDLSRLTSNPISEQTADEQTRLNEWERVKTLFAESGILTEDYLSSIRSRAVIRLQPIPELEPTEEPLCIDGASLEQLENLSLDPEIDDIMTGYSTLESIVLLIEEEKYEQVIALARSQSDNPFLSVVPSELIVEGEPALAEEILWLIESPIHQVRAREYITNAYQQLEHAQKAFDTTAEAIEITQSEAFRTDISAEVVRVEHPELSKEAVDALYEAKVTSRIESYLSHIIQSYARYANAEAIGQLVHKVNNSELRTEILLESLHIQDALSQIRDFSDLSDNNLLTIANEATKEQLLMTALQAAVSIRSAHTQSSVLINIANLYSFGRLAYGIVRTVTLDIKGLSDSRRANAIRHSLYQQAEANNTEENNAEENNFEQFDHLLAQIQRRYSQPDS